MKETNQKPQNKPVGSMTFLFLTWFILFLGLGGYKYFQEKDPEKITFAQFMDKVNQEAISKVSYSPINYQIQGEYFDKVLQKNIKFETMGDLSKDIFLNKLSEKRIIPDYVAPEQPSFIVSMLASIIPISLLLVGFYLIFKVITKNSNGGVANFSKSKFKEITKDSSNIKFEDIAGIDEAKEELTEIVDFLKNPEKYSKLGAKIPKGALLVGPPGTGKTMLAKAIANEANANFLSLSGSEFVEMFVGVGASRVRDLFKEARAKSPCIIFIDEIDAIGKKRNANGNSGGHDEREQTLNQLLVEMDGFDITSNIIVLAATNRKEVLDNALLRAGRFDRIVYVPLPDINGRKKILETHAKKIKLKDGLSLQQLAQGTSGMAGADLANLINEAAIQAAKTNSEYVSKEHLEYARDKILMGPERKTLVLSEKEKVTTAYHEAGHALISSVLDGLDKVHKVSIIPRGMALGVTQTISEENQVSLSKDKAIKMIAMLFGGRVAEKIKFDHYTTGASNDIERATQLARRMVCEWGMSPLGPINFNKDHNGMITSYDLSEQTKINIDKEVQTILDEAEEYAEHTIKKNQGLLERIAQELILKETIDEHELLEILKMA